MALKKYGIGLLLLVFILPFLWGCPYESKVPLSKSTEAEIDKELLGEWQEKEGGGSIMIKQFNEHELLIMGKEDEKIQCDVIRAFVTVVNDKRFLNVQVIQTPPADGGWFIANYTIAGGTLTIWVVDEKLFKQPFTSSKALYRFVKRNLGNKDLYGDSETVYQRVK